MRHLSSHRFPAMYQPPPLRELPELAPPDTHDLLIEAYKQDVEQCIIVERGTLKPPN